MMVDMVLRAWRGLEGLETYCCGEERGMGVGGGWWGMEIGMLGGEGLGWVLGGEEGRWIYVGGVDYVEGSFVE